MKKVLTFIMAIYYNINRKQERFCSSEIKNLFCQCFTKHAKSEHAVFHICKRHIRHCGDTVKDKVRGDNLAGFVVSETDTFIEFQYL